MVGLVLATLAVVTQEGRPKPVDPQTFVSQDGHARLWVNPDTMYAEAGATYRLTIDGKVRWTKRYPFSLRDVAVSEDGTFGGYAYLDGPYAPGTLLVAIVRPDGKLVREERHARKFGPTFHSAPNPRVDGLLFDPISDRLRLRIDDSGQDGGEYWWNYRLSTGKREPALRLSPPKEFASCWEARTVPGTSYTLLSWRYFEEADGYLSQLVDQSVKPIWSLELPGKVERALAADPILGVGLNRFEIRHAVPAQRVTYEVEGTSVREVARSPYVPPVPVKAEPSVYPTKTLRTMGRVRLPVRGPSPIDRLGEFYAIGADRFVALREGDRPALVEIDGRGRVRREVRLKPNDANVYWRRTLAWNGGRRFVLFESAGESAKTSRAWRIDLQTGRMNSLNGFRSSPVRAAAGAPDGSFATISEGSSRLAFFDPEGRRRWAKSEDGYRGTPDELLSPKDLTIDRQGRIVVLDVVKDALQRFSREGRFLGAVDLKKAWKREASYPCALSLDLGDGLVVYDFSSDRPAVRIRADGRIVSQTGLRLPDGKHLTNDHDFQIDPQGRLWMTNGYGLFRLDARGVVDRKIAPPHIAGTIDEIRDLVVAPNGLIYALDSADARVHVFNEKGRRRFVAQPQARDFDARPDARIQVSRSGEIYLGPRYGIEDVKFGLDGRRIEKQSTARRGKRFQPTGARPKVVLPGWRWKGKELLDEKGRLVTKVERWPDARWLDDAELLFAPDGRFVAVDGGYATSPARMALYAANGAPLGLAKLPSGLESPLGAIFDGKRVVFWDGLRMNAVGLDGKPLWQATLPASGGWIYPSRGGIAWWKGATVTWFAMP